MDNVVKIETPMTQGSSGLTPEEEIKKHPKAKVFYLGDPKNKDEQNDLDDYQKLLEELADGNAEKITSSGVWHNGEFRVFVTWYEIERVPTIPPPKEEKKEEKIEEEPEKNEDGSIKIKDEKDDKEGGKESVRTNVESYESGAK